VDVEFVDEHDHAGAGVASAEADVVQAAVVPDGELAVTVDPVAADAVVLVDEDALPGRPGLGWCGVGRCRGAAADAGARALRVVVGGKLVELGL
jgi:hypothetical protein